MVFLLSENPSIAQHFMSEIRDVKIQTDAMRFRRNMERIGEVFAYEISKTLTYLPVLVETPLGQASQLELERKVVIATILRAGLPLHQGLLNYFDKAGNAFVSAFRKHHLGGRFEIALEYVSCPNLDDIDLILCDPMIATGVSMELALKELLGFGEPRSIHIVGAIASRQGVEHLSRLFPKARFWLGSIDEELTAKAYIVPGLGDAGDLSYGAKLQE